MNLRADGIDEFLNRLVGHADDLVVSMLDILINLHQRECLAFDVALLAADVDEDLRDGLLFELRGWNTEVVLSRRVEFEININVVLFCNSKSMRGRFIVSSYR